MWRRVGLFLGLLIALAIFVAGAMYLKVGRVGLLATLVTGAACIFASLLTGCWAAWSISRSKVDQVFAVFGGLALKLLLVLPPCLSVFLLDSRFRADPKTEYAFWGSLLGCYVGSLMIEHWVMGAGFAPESLS